METNNTPLSTVYQLPWDFGCCWICWTRPGPRREGKTACTRGCLATGTILISYQESFQSLLYPIPPLLLHYYSKMKAKTKKSDRSSASNLKNVRTDKVITIIWYHDNNLFLSFQTDFNKDATMWTKLLSSPPASPFAWLDHCDEGLQESREGPVRGPGPVVISAAGRSTVTWGSAGMRLKQVSGFRGGINLLWISLN